MKTFEIEKKDSKRRSNDKMLVRMLANMFVGIANHANMRLSPTMLADIYVGQHFLRIFFFTNMFVTIANRAIMLANIVFEGCCSKCWPTCRPFCGRLKFSEDIISGNKLF